MDKVQGFSLDFWSGYFQSPGFVSVGDDKGGGDLKKIPLKPKEPTLRQILTHYVCFKYEMKLSDMVF